MSATPKQKQDDEEEEEQRILERQPVDAAPPVEAITYGERYLPAHSAPSP